MTRGDVVLVRFPHPSGARGKKRPAVIVQSDAYRRSLKTVVVAEVTKNLKMANDPACLLVEVNTPTRQATGLKHDSVVSCLLLATIDGDRVDKVLGTLSTAMLAKLDACLKAALAVPYRRRLLRRYDSFCPVPGAGGGGVLRYSAVLMMPI